MFFPIFCIANSHMAHVFFVVDMALLMRCAIFLCVECPLFYVDVIRQREGPTPFSLSIFCVANVFSRQHSFFV